MCVYNSKPLPVILFFISAEICLDVLRMPHSFLFYDFGTAP